MKILGNKLISECTAYDFKDELERKKIRHWLKSVSAFANTEGGALYFGVSKVGCFLLLHHSVQCPLWKDGCGFPVHY